MDDRMDTHARAYQIQALLRCAMLAEENECSGLDWKGTPQVLALAEEMMGKLVDSIENISVLPSEARDDVHLEGAA